MDATRNALIAMLRQLLKEMELVSSQGAGYYTCSPFAERFNKLLGESRKLFPGGDTQIIGTFEPLEENDPKDPGDKSKVLVTIRVEVGQLITLLVATGDETS